MVGLNILMEKFAGKCLHVLVILQVGTVCVYQCAECLSGLGIANGSIPDSSLRSSVGDAAGGRLHSPRSAWCFRSGDGDRVTWSVDLGQLQLVSGVLSQGPPVSMFQLGYENRLQFQMKFSVDGESYQTCCGSQTLRFWHTDTQTTASRVQTHGLGRIVVARHVTLTFNASAIWAGNENKCFRFEVIGCQSGWTPSMQMKHFGDIHGWIEVKWTQPTVALMWYSLPVTHRLETKKYLYQITDGDILSVKSEHPSPTSGELVTQQRRLLLLSPIWQHSYKVRLRCLIGQHSIPCAEYSFVAKLCPKQRWCPQNNLLLFILPNSLNTQWRAENGSLRLNWNYSEIGWNVTQYVLNITSHKGVQLYSQRIASGVTEWEITSLQALGRYEVYFSPEAQDVSKPESFHRSLYILDPESTPLSKSDHLTSGVVQDSAVFTADLSFEMTPQWNGHLVVTWQNALASLAPSINLPAVGYQLNVTAGGEHWLSVELDATQTQIEQGGLKAGQEYTAILGCRFPGLTIICGQAKINTVLPPIFQAQSEDSALVFDMPVTAVGWDQASETCRRRGGSLAAVTSSLRETHVLQLLDSAAVQNAWIGVSLCENQISRHHSSPCCVKMERSDGGTDAWAGPDFGTVSTLSQPAHTPQSEYEWQREWCQTPLAPICQSRVTSDMVLNTVNVSAVSSSPLSLRVFWTQSNSSWLPNNHTVVICPLIDLERPWQLLALPCESAEVRDAEEVTVRGLRGYHEYNVSVRSEYIAGLIVQSNVITARIVPEESVMVRISAEGTISAVWSRRVVINQSTAPAKVVLRQVGSNPGMDSFSARPTFGGLTHGSRLDADMALRLKPGSDTQVRMKQPIARLSSDHVTIQPSNQIRFSDIEFGSTYQLIAFNDGEESSRDFATFVAYPTCSAGEWQHGHLCYRQSNRAATFADAQSICTADGTGQQMASAPMQEDLDIFMDMAATFGETFWMQTDEQSNPESSDPSLTGDWVWQRHKYEVSLPDLADSLISRTESNRSASIIFPDDPQTSTPAPGGYEHLQLLPRDVVPAPGLQECTYVTSSGVRVSELCTELRKTVCARRLKADLVALQAGSITTRSTLDSLKIDWPASNTWKSVYTINLTEIRVDSNSAARGRSKRADMRLHRSQTVTAPPVVLRNLEKNTVYDIIIKQSAADNDVIIGPMRLSTLDPLFVRSNMFPSDNLHYNLLSWSFVLAIVASLVACLHSVIYRICDVDSVMLTTGSVLLFIWFLLLLLANGGPLDAPQLTHLCRLTDAVIYGVVACSLATSVVRVILAHYRIEDDYKQNERGHLCRLFFYLLLPQPFLASLSYYLYENTGEQRFSCLTTVSVENRSMWLQLVNIASLNTIAILFSVRSRNRVSKMPAPNDSVSYRQPFCTLRIQRAVLLIHVHVLTLCWLFVLMAFNLQLLPTIHTATAVILLHILLQIFGISSCTKDHPALSTASSRTASLQPAENAAVGDPHQAVFDERRLNNFVYGDEMAGQTMSTINEMASLTPVDVQNV